VPEDLAGARAIVLPSCQGISQRGWDGILAAVDRGATLFCSGWFECDDAGLPASRLGLPRRPLRAVEEVGRGGDLPPAAVRFAGSLPESWFAVADSATWRETARGQGRILHHRLPIDWAEPGAGTALAYERLAATLAADTAPEIAVQVDGSGSCLVRLLEMRDSLVAVLVNETPVARTVRLARRDAESAAVELVAPPARAALFVLDPLTLAVQ
jgi:hypothetical protein